MAPPRARSFAAAIRERREPRAGQSPAPASPVDAGPAGGPRLAESDST